MRTEDLVCLAYSSKIDLVTAHSWLHWPKGVKVDLTKGTWSYRGENFQIGKNRQRSLETGTGVIGVYTRKTEDINKMLEIARAVEVDALSAR